MQRPEDAIVSLYPKPLARSYAQAIGRFDAFQAARDFLATFEAMLQHLVFTGLARASAEALREPRIASALARILPRPTLGGLVELVRELDAGLGYTLAGLPLAERRDDLPHLATLAARRTETAPSRVTLSKALSALVELRNDEAHRRIGSAELAAEAPRLRGAIEELLLALPVLRHELVHAERVSRRRTSLEVFLKVFRGAGPAVPMRDVPELPLEVDLIEGALYLHDPDTSRFDEISPWYLVAGDDLVVFSGLGSDQRPTFACPYARVDTRELGAAANLLRERAPFLFAAAHEPMRRGTSAHSTEPRTTPNEPARDGLATPVGPATTPAIPAPAGDPAATFAATEKAPAAPRTTATSKKPLRIGLLFESGAALGKVVERFVASELPNVTVELIVHGPDHYERAREEFLVGDFDIVLLDDIWIPAYAAAGALAPLDPFLAQRMGSPVPFIGDLLRWGRAQCPGDAPGDQHQVAVPLMGNVLMSLYRHDLVAEVLGPGTRVEFPWGSLHEGGPARGIARPIGMRLDTRNNVVEVFLEVLRAMGEPERLPPGATAPVELPAAGVARALAWMRATTGGSVDRFVNSADLETDLASGTSALLVGWPSWIREASLAADVTLTQLRVARISATPLLGAWYLAVRQSSSNPEAAARIVLELSTRVAWQEALASELMVPVLDTIEPASLRKHAFWRQNWAAVRDALRRARPRPRTPRWEEIERALGDAIIEALESPDANAGLVTQDDLFVVTP